MMSTVLSKVVLRNALLAVITQLHIMIITEIVPKIILFAFFFS